MMNERAEELVTAPQEAGAFHGEASLRQAAVDRLEGAIADAPAEGPVWHEGGIAAVLAGGAPDPASVLGIPPAVLAILDEVAPFFDDQPGQRATFARRFVDGVRAGADLRDVPRRMARALRDDPTLRVPPVHHTNDRTVFDAMSEEESVPAQIGQWMGAHAAHASADAGFDQTQHDRALAALEQLWEETRVQRSRGDWPSLPRLLEARDPELAARYVASLEVGNAASISMGRRAGEAFLTLVGEASTRARP